MGTTVNRALRFPDVTDRVTDGATAIEHLAEDVDAILGKGSPTVANWAPTFWAGGVQLPGFMDTTEDGWFRIDGGVLTASCRWIVNEAGHSGTLVCVLPWNLVGAHSGNWHGNVKVGRFMVLGNNGDTHDQGELTRGTNGPEACFLKDGSTTGWWAPSSIEQWTRIHVDFHCRVAL